MYQCRRMGVLLVDRSVGQTDDTNANVIRLGWRKMTFFTPGLFFQIGNKEYKDIRQHMGGRAEGTTGTRG